MLIALLAVGAAALPSAEWVCGLAVLLGLAGVMLLRGNPWRSGSLLVAALALAVGLLDIFAGLLSPQPHGVGLSTTYEPYWMVDDAELGYRMRPDSAVRARETWGDQTIFDVTYHMNKDATRVTPPAPAGADTYLFMGDSFVFGQGLPDDQTLAAQFARLNDFKVRTVNLSALGYAPNQLVRAIEIGRLDSLVGQPVKAVITWIIPGHLWRVFGDGPWLGSSPRYIVEDGKPVYTGSFDRHRWLSPLAGLRHIAGQNLAFVHAIGARQREDAEGELFTALMQRLQSLAREKFDAPLVVVYSWPDETSAPGHDNSEVAQPKLVAILAGLRQHGIPLISVDKLTYGQDVNKLLFVQDGHPKAYTNELIAAELKRRLITP
ncbi:MAG TPA: hypothetical protein VMI56_21430 [Reyranella sp.]|nr:hypothetical protein [Reyranella sp.]